MKKTSKYYHHRDKGCVLISRLRTSREMFRLKRNRVSMHIKYCEKHKVETCRCGWEWGHHPKTLAWLTN